MLVDGTYELFRHHFGRPKGTTKREELSATVGTLSSVVALLEAGTTHLGVATDHVIESFRNALWPGYKTGEGVAQELKAQFPVLEECMTALGVRVWAMVDLEADDALASAAEVVTSAGWLNRVFIASPDKDLAQCVRGEVVVQLDRRSGKVIDEQGVRLRFGVPPTSIPDWLALVGDAADGFPGLAGWGRASASTVLAHYQHLDAIPDSVSEWDDEVRQKVRGAPRLATVLAEQRELAELFLNLATLRLDDSLLTSVEDLRWPGPSRDWPAVSRWLGEDRLTSRVEALASRIV
jgi:5'-3' exonuclease